MMALICFVVALAASIIGATTGLGGGIITKPVLDALSGMSSADVNLLSGCTVVAMAAMAFFNRRSEVRSGVDKRLYFLAGGSAVGGIIGKELFSLLADSLPKGPVTAVQSALLAIACALTLLYMAVKHKLRAHDFTGKPICAIAGLCLGVVSAFLGIGGGPFNIIVLSWLFAMSAKEASLGSIFIIFFSQGASVLLTLILDVPPVDLTVLAVMVVGGIIGGSVGGIIGKVLSEKQTLAAFCATVGLIVLIACYNFGAAVLV